MKISRSFKNSGARWHRWPGKRPGHSELWARYPLTPSFSGVVSWATVVEARITTVFLDISYSYKSRSIGNIAVTETIKRPILILNTGVFNYCLPVQFSFMKIFSEQLNP
jgi:hypothetical protein